MAEGEGDGEVAVLPVLLKLPAGSSWAAEKDKAEECVFVCVCFFNGINEELLRCDVIPQ